MKHRIFTILCLLFCVMIGVNARTIKDFFVSEPGNVLPLLSQSKKMDMVDYLSVGRKIEVENALGVGSHINDATDDYISIQVSESSCVELLLLCGAKNDSVIVAVTTVNLPAKDSRVEFYDTRWNRLDAVKHFKAPVMKDFVSIPKGDKKKVSEVLNAVPMSLIYYSIDPATRNLVARHSLKDFMTKEEYEKIAPYLCDSVTYRPKGTKFIKK